MKFTCTLVFTTEAETQADAFDLTTAAAEHLLDTFNDNNSISPPVYVEVQPCSDH
jgi:hypothetical protein